ncbi:msl6202 [Mesorhizobium japonicum MAFF 303099]|uniref:Msl6202 protein n=1 Tax=Mesorhizobium japonicum (strain LMG 29417 / CECT 9101 / MAFF 303099) TaxID=266835 RepID=Q98A13_RHILO|nr:msl6202 [Mesorhizobium japonicum MAFF 303099]
MFREPASPAMVTIMTPEMPSPALWNDRAHQVAIPLNPFMMDRHPSRPIEV